MQGQKTVCQQYYFPRFSSKNIFTQWTRKTKANQKKIASYKYKDNIFKRFFMKLKDVVPEQSFICPNSANKCMIIELLAKFYLTARFNHALREANREIAGERKSQNKKVLKLRHK